MIRPIGFADILSAPNARELIAEYSAECSIAEIGPINPQKAIYAALEANRAMQCFGAFKDDTLTGFATVLVSVNPHYGRKLAVIESLFVTAENRRSDAGTELLAAVESYARGTECAGILYSAPAGGSLERLLQRRAQYTLTNTVFFRSLA